MPQVGMVDLVLTDPPYGDTSLEWDVFGDAWVPYARDSLKPSGSMWVFGSLKHLFRLSQGLSGLKLVQDIVWEKQNGTGAQADRFRRVHEHAIHLILEGSVWRDVYHSTQYTMDARKKVVRRKERPPHWGVIENSTYVSEDGGPRVMRSVFHVNNCHGYADHPTQKPEGVVSPLILYSSPLNGMVLDPFMGSGTTAIVCEKNARPWVGIEIEEKYCEIAAKRLEAERSQLKLGWG
jgi:site-specific DNA-methyltransferase (adenine-specific)